MSTFAVEYAYADRPSDLAAVRPEHRGFLRRLLEEGALLASGPRSGQVVEQEQGSAAVERTEAAGALLLLRASDAEAALRLLDDDPFMIAGLVVRRAVRAWDPVIGPWGV